MHGCFYGAVFARGHATWHAYRGMIGEEEEALAASAA
jgi:uncharacterized membrane protein